MKKFILVLFVVISSCHAGGYSIIEPLLKQADKNKIISNITALKADTLLNVKEAAQKNEVIAQLNALNTKINVLTAETRIKTIEELSIINTAEVGK